ncbi:MAG: hypothetical protein WBA43_25445, partial [Elainellaceae cyanobacterium]
MNSSLSWIDYGVGILVQYRQSPFYKDWLIKTPAQDAIASWVFKWHRFRQANVLALACIAQQGQQQGDKMVDQGG